MLKNESVWCCFSVGSTLALALLEFIGLITPSLQQEVHSRLDMALIKLGPIHSSYF